MNRWMDGWRKEGRKEGWVEGRRKEGKMRCISVLRYIELNIGKSAAVPLASACELAA